MRTSSTDSPVGVSENTVTVLTVGCGGCFGRLFGEVANIVSTVTNSSHCRLLFSVYQSVSVNLLVVFELVIAVQNSFRASCEFFDFVFSAHHRPSVLSVWHIDKKGRNRVPNVRNLLELLNRV